MGDLDVNAPISFRTEPIDMSKVATIKHEIKMKIMDSAGDVSEEKIRVSIPKYNDTENEILLMTCKEMLNVVSTYELFKNEKGERVFDRFRQNLGGAALDAWDDAVTGVSKTEHYFKEAINELVEEIMGDEAYEEQYEYMTETMKPKDLDVASWTRQLRKMNSYLPFLKKGAKPIEEPEFVKKIHTKRIPASWKTQYKLAGGHKCTSITNSMKILRIIEKEERSKNNKNNKNKKKEGEFRNECRKCPGGGHEWYDCPHNRNGRNHRGRNPERENNAIERSRNDSGERSRQCEIIERVTWQDDE